MKTEAQIKQESEISRTGTLVREARGVLQKAEAALADNEDRILGYRQNIADNQMEMDILGNFESLNSNLKKKYIDLQDTIKYQKSFISGAEAEVATLNHNTTMARSRLNVAQNDYRDAQTMNRESDGLTSNERTKLSQTSMLKMNMKEKKYWADRVGGIEKLREIVPLI